MKRKVIVLLFSGIFLLSAIIQINWLIKYCVSDLDFYTDFYGDYHGSLSLREGKSLYDGIYHHVPLMALIIYPLSYLKIEQAFFFWGIISIIFYYLSILLVFRICKFKPEVSLLLILAILPVWYPFLAHLALGQWSSIIAACIFGGWLSIKTDKCRTGGALFGFATALKLYPGLIGFFLMLQCQWRALKFMIFFFSLFSAISYFGVGTENFKDFIFNDIHSNSDYFLYYPANHSIWAIIGRFFVTNPWVKPFFHLPLLAKILSIGISIIIISTMVICLKDLPDNKTKDLGFSFVCVAMLLLSPLTWQHYFVILILPIGILFKNIRKEINQKIKLFLIIIVTTLSIPDIHWTRLILDLSVKKKDFIEPSLWNFLLIFPSIGLIGLLILILLKLKKTKNTKLLS